MMTIIKKYDIKVFINKIFNAIVLIL